MEEKKAAAYYEELTRKGEGAARFKQGLGFSAGSHSPPKPGSAHPSSFLSNFVRASSPSKTSEFQKQAQLKSIQHKLNTKNAEKSRRRSRSREEYRQRDDHERRRSRRSDSDDDDDERRHRHRHRGRDSYDDDDDDDDDRRRVSKEKKNSGPDYARLIPGYDNMTPAERVKAKMKLQLSETAGNDSVKGAGWERFEFNKDAPLDDEEEVEVAEDDASLVKHIGQSFRFSAVEARREEQIKAAHEEAMFGAPAFPPPITSDSEPEREIKEKEDNQKDLAKSLLSESVLASKKGSWRDQVRSREA